MARQNSPQEQTTPLTATNLEQIPSGPSMLQAYLDNSYESTTIERLGATNWRQLSEELDSIERQLRSSKQDLSSHHHSSEKSVRCLLSQAMTSTNYFL